MLHWCLILVNVWSVKLKKKKKERTQNKKNPATNKILSYL